MPAYGAAPRTKRIPHLFFQTFFASYKMPVALHIGAIHIILRFLFAYITLAYDFMPATAGKFWVIDIKRRHHYAIIKNIKFAFEVFIGIFLHIAHDSAI